MGLNLHWIVGSEGIPKLSAKEVNIWQMAEEAKFRKSGGNRWSTKQDLVGKVVENIGEA